jgi:hypothetical protein
VGLFAGAGTCVALVERGAQRLDVSWGHDVLENDVAIAAEGLGGIRDAAFGCGHEPPDFPPPRLQRIYPAIIGPSTYLGRIDRTAALGKLTHRDEQGAMPLCYMILTVCAMGR